MRITAQTILEFLGEGEEPEEIIAQGSPSLEMDDIRACMLAAASLMDHPVRHPAYDLEIHAALVGIAEVRLATKRRRLAG